MRNLAGCAALAVLVGGCGSTGYAVDLDIAEGCGVGAAELQIDVALTPSHSSNPVIVKGPSLFPSGHRHVVVIPPAGTTELTITVRALDGQQHVVAMSAIKVAVAGTEIDYETISFGGCVYDGGAVVDGGADGGMKRLTAISITPTNPQLGKGTSLQLTATGKYSDRSVMNLTAVAVWSSTAKGTATVDKGGLLTAVAPGVVGIEAVVDGVTGFDAVQVTTAALKSIVIAPANSRLAKGTTVQLTATGLFDNNSSQDLSASVTWSSSNAAVATVAAKGGLATGIGAGMTSLTAAQGGITGTTSLTVSVATLTSIAVTPTNPTVAVATVEPFKATGTYSDLSTQDLTGQAAWSSSDLTVATVDNAGNATAKGAGTSTLSAALSGMTGSTLLTVSTATLTSIAIKPVSPTLAKGTSLQLSAIGTWSDGSTQVITTQVTWDSSADMIATVSDAMGSQGVAVGVDKGVATVSATLDNVVGMISLKVTNAALVSLAVSPPSATIPKGTSQQFSAVGTYSDQSTQDLTATATWSSSNVGTATIGTGMMNPGLAFGVAAGMATLTAASGQVSGTATLTVVAVALQSITITPADPTVPNGLTQQFTAMGTYQDNSMQDITQSVLWSSSAINVATVSNAMGNRGSATVVGEGTTKITASTMNISGETSLTGAAAVPLTLVITPMNAMGTLGKATSFTATANFSDKTQKIETAQANWSTNSLALTCIQGSCRAVAMGTYTVTAMWSGLTGTAMLTIK